MIGVARSGVNAKLTELVKFVTQWPGPHRAGSMTALFPARP